MNKIQQDVRVAIVGSGFAGLGMAIRLRQAGIERLRRARAGRRRRRHVARQHAIPGCAVRRAVAPVLVLLRAEPGVDAAPSRRSRRSGDYLRDVADDFGVRPHVRLRPRAARRAAGTRTTQRWQRRDLRRRSSPRASSSPAWAPLSEPSIPRLPGLETLRGRRPSTPPAGTTTYDLDRQARRRDRHRRLGDPVRARGSSRRSARCSVFQRTPPWIMPHPDRPLRRRERRAVPRAAGGRSSAVRGGDLLGARERSCWRSRTRASCSRVPSGSRARTWTQQVADPALRAKLTPDLRDRLQADPDVQRLLPGAARSRTSSWSRTASREVRANGDRHAPTAPSARSTRSSSAPASTSPTCRAAEWLRGRDGRSLAEVWHEHGHAGACAARRSPASRTSSCSSARTPASGHNSIVFMIESQIALRDRRAAHDGRSAAPPRSRSAPEAQARLQRAAPASRCAAPSGRRAAARAGTSTRTAATRRCGPPSRGPSASAPAGSTARTTSCARHGPRASRWRPDRRARADVSPLLH